MPDINDIPVRVGSPSFDANALPLLHEIRHALGALASGGEARVIDLMAIPFGPGDEDLLLQVLGKGEVEASIDALGTSRVWESAYPGVWLLDHRDAEGRRIAFQVQVNTVPDILLTPAGDMAEAAERLDERLRQLGDTPEA
jgi:hydrogenase-1 operon protein HyaF